MKIAFLHTGQPRTYKRCVNNWLKVADRYESDFYIASYDLDGTRKDPIPDNARQFDGHIMHDNFFNPIMDQTPIDQDDFVTTIGILDPKVVEILSWENSDAKIRSDMNEVGALGGNFWANLPTTLWHQFYIVKELYKSIPNPDQYDIIVRTRLDTAWVGYPLFEKIDHVEYPSYTELHPHDYLAYGPPNLMRRVCNVYDELASMWANRGNHDKGLHLVGQDSHHTFGLLYNEIPSRPTYNNVMSIVRVGMYPTSNDVSFLLDPAHASRWKDVMGVNSHRNYNGLT